MEIGQCALMLICFGGGIALITLALFGGMLINKWWNTPPAPPSEPPSGLLSKAMRYMKDEANRLGITLHRAMAVATCVVFFSMIGWGGVSAYNNVTVTDCGKGDVAIKLPDPAKRVIVAAGLPCPCGCGCEK